VCGGAGGGGYVRCRRLVCRDLVPSALDSDELEIFSRSTVSRGIPGPAHAGAKQSTRSCACQSVFAVACGGQTKNTKGGREACARREK
jgi:hypothetical protein